MNILYLRAAGMVDVEDVRQTAEAIAGQFEFDVRVLDPLPDPAGAFDPVRRQYNSVLVLRELVASCPADAHRLIGLTGRDLFIPMLSFVFGQAQLGGRVALVSFARLRQEFYGLPPSPPVFAHRARKEVFHELGHTFGLTHCPDHGCPMSLSTGIAQVDTKSGRYCPSCAAMLRDHGVPLAELESTL